MMNLPKLKHQQPEPEEAATNEFSRVITEIKI